MQFNLINLRPKFLLSFFACIKYQSIIPLLVSLVLVIWNSFLFDNHFPKEQFCNAIYALQKLGICFGFNLIKFLTPNFFKCIGILSFLMLSNIAPELI